MRFRSMAIKASIILGVIAALSIVSVRWHGSSPDGKGSSGMGIFLAKPAFAQTDGASFLEQEAGISAYTNVGRSIDLAKAKTVFRTLERETSEYVIGSVPIPDYPETEDVHAYVHKDGWIVSYYLSSEPAAKIVDWSNYGEDEKMEGTKLDVGMLIVGGTAGVPVRDAQYYDFRNPDSNRLMIITEAVWSAELDSGVNEEMFKINLPGDFVFYERSYSHCNNGASDNNSGSSYMYINEEKIAEIKGRFTTYGLLTPVQLFLDIDHTIKVVGQYSSGGWGGYWKNSCPTYGAIVLIYREQ